MSSSSVRCPFQPSIRGHRTVSSEKIDPFIPLSVLSSEKGLSFYFVTAICKMLDRFEVHTTLVTLVIAFSDQITSLCPWPIRGDRKAVGLTNKFEMTRISWVRKVDVKISPRRLVSSLDTISTQLLPRCSNPEITMLKVVEDLHSLLVK